VRDAHQHSSRMEAAKTTLPAWTSSEGSCYHGPAAIRAACAHLPVCFARRTTTGSCAHVSEPLLFTPARPKSITRPYLESRFEAMLSGSVHGTLIQVPTLQASDVSHDSSGGYRQLPSVSTKQFGQFWAHTRLAAAETNRQAGRLHSKGELATESCPAFHHRVAQLLCVPGLVVLASLGAARPAAVYRLANLSPRVRSHPTRLGQAPGPLIIAVTKTQMHWVMSITRPVSCSSFYLRGSSTVPAGRQCLPFLAASSLKTSAKPQSSRQCILTGQALLKRNLSSFVPRGAKVGSSNAHNP
jgi:hypothetical protein